MNNDLKYQVQKEDLTLRRMFVEAIAETDYLESVKKEPDVFHETLSLAQDRNWMQPTRLAKDLDLSDSNTRKWFKINPNERSTPSHIIMETALKAVIKLMTIDIKSLQSELDSPIVSQSQVKSKEIKPEARKKILVAVAYPQPAHNT